MVRRETSAVDDVIQMINNMNLNMNVNVVFEISTFEVRYYHMKQRNYSDAYCNMYMYLMTWLHILDKLF